MSKALRLYRKSEAALMAAIEIYNKPDFQYREETFAILAINAWELLLKAKVLADNGNDLRALYVYEQRPKTDGTRTARRYVRRNRTGNVHTIGMSAAIAALDADPKSRVAPEARANLDALTEIRDNAVHYVNAGFELARHVLAVGTASLRNFIALAKKWFGQDLGRYSLYLMPIGFLTTPSATAISVGGDEGKLVNYLRDLSAAQGSVTSTATFHIALDVNLTFKRSATDAISTFTLTNDPNAPPVYLSEEDIRARYPWDYRELMKRCRSRYTDFKENARFHDIRRPLLKVSKYVRDRYLDPGNPNSSKKAFHSPNIMAEFDKHYTKRA